MMKSRRCTGILCRRLTLQRPKWMVRMSQKESVQGLKDALELGFSYNLKSRLTAAPCFFCFFKKHIECVRHTLFEC